MTTAAQSRQSPAEALVPAAQARAVATDPASELRAFLSALLEAQARLVGAVSGVVMLAESGARRGMIGATFMPPGAPAFDEALSRRIERLAGEVFASANEPGPPAARAEDVTLTRPGDVYAPGPTHRLVASALAADGRVEAASILLLPHERGFELARTAALLSLTGARFEAYLWKQQCLNEAQQRVKLRAALELLDASQQGITAPAMASLLCNELQRRFGCSRASISLIQGDRLRLMAVSGADTFDRRGAAVEAIETAMEECAAQDTEVACPPPPEQDRDPLQRRVTRAHEELSRRHGPAAILSLPLRLEGDLVGVALLERDASDPFPPGSAALLRLVAEFIGPALWTRRLADRGILAVVRDRTLELGEAVVGPRHTGAKLLVSLIAGLILVGLAVPMPDPVVARAEVRPAVARAIVAPYAGFLKGVEVKPGDTVTANQALFTMDDTEYRLHLQELEAERDSLATQRDDAQARGDAGKKRGFDAQLAENEARISAAKDRIERAVVRSPIAGVVSRGDLDLFVGAKIDPGQPLLEVAGAELHAMVQVPERDAQRVRIGQRGTLATRALPDERLQVEVLRINPAAEVVDQHNVYVAEVTVNTGAEGAAAPHHAVDQSWLRPGMTGTVRLDAGRTPPLIRILRPVVDELRMRLWW